MVLFGKREKPVFKMFSFQVVFFFIIFLFIVRSWEKVSASNLFLFRVISYLTYSWVLISFRISLLYYLFSKL